MICDMNPKKALFDSSISFFRTSKTFPDVSHWSNRYGSLKSNGGILRGKDIGDKEWWDGWRISDRLASVKRISMGR